MKTHTTFDSILSDLVIESRQTVSLCSTKSDTILAKALRLRNALANIQFHRESGGKINTPEVEEHLSGARLDCEALAQHGIRDSRFYEGIIYLGKRFLRWELPQYKESTP